MGILKTKFLNITVIYFNFQKQHDSLKNTRTKNFDSCKAFINAQPKLL